MSNQKTIKNCFSFSGIGIHSGNACSMQVLPAKAGTGICFIVTDASPPVEIPASPSYIVKKSRETSLAKDDIEIRTVEHFLAAAHGLGIDNLIIEITGRELPTVDGSALPFVEAFQKAGIVVLDYPKKVFMVHSSIAIENDDGEASLIILPFTHFRISCFVDFPVIGCQFFSFDSEKHSFEKEIAPARTFGYAEEIEALKEKGLAKGASLENALGINKDGYMNPPRFPNEPVRHKILDLFGDLALLNGYIKGHIIAIKSGHKLNLELMERLEVIYGKN
ncbi:MAG: UDP-3-O-acyl-N-acetylglucosamine deacetylase [Candidatus Saganbacteria bacterium]|nr:UDP-3-O-acyl-N-acetylglucosamine deacetylase [Candidatus Saganbacteria bacterium]